MKRVVNQINQFLDLKNLAPALEKNYDLGKRYFSYEVLEENLLPIIESF